MRGVSHIVVGAAAMLALHLAHPALSLPFALKLGANVLGSLMPDIDSSQSTIRHATGTAEGDLLGSLVTAVMPRHRGWIHSLVPALIITLVCWWSRSTYAICFSVGWVAHILMDKVMSWVGVRNGSLGELAVVMLSMIGIYKNAR